MKKVINAAAQSITFTFEGAESVTLNMSQVTPANATYAMLHGFAARIGDNAAITKSAENGFNVTEAMRRDAVLELVEHYASGSTDWNLKPSARKAPQNLTWLAIATARGVAYEVIAAEKAEADLAELMALEGIPRE